MFNRNNEIRGVKLWNYNIVKIMDLLMHSEYSNVNWTFCH